MTRPYVLIFGWQVWGLIAAAGLFFAVPVLVWFSKEGGVVLLLGAAGVSIIAFELWSREKQFPLVLLDLAVQEARTIGRSDGDPGFDSARAFEIYQTLALPHGMDFRDRSATAQITVRLAQAAAHARVFGKVPSFANPELDPQEIERQWSEFSSVPDAVGMVSLFVLIGLGFGAGTAWGLAIGAAALGSLLRWFAYPRTLWSNVGFSTIRTVVLWALCAWAVWRCWSADFKAQAVVLLATRIILQVAFTFVGFALFDVPIAARSGALVPKRLFWQRFLGVSDVAEPIDPARDGVGVPRPHVLAVIAIATATGWVSLMQWLGPQ